jgi:hypothetical protein
LVDITPKLPTPRPTFNAQEAESWREISVPIRYRIESTVIAFGRDIESIQESPSRDEELIAMTVTQEFDAFISYRRQDPDKAFARNLLKHLEAAGLKAAIDEHFDPAATFLEEMERCIKESRYTLAVMSPRYLESGNCVEEAIICKVLDMAERRRRIIPLTIESVTMPTWLYNVVGINFTDPNPLVDPYAKLLAKLQNL